MLINVCVVEWDPIVRLGLSAALSEDPRIRICGAGFDAHAVEQAKHTPSAVVVGPQHSRRYRPDIAELIAAIRERFVIGPVIVLGFQPLHSDTEHPNENGRVGFRNVVFLPNPPHPVDLARIVIRAVLRFASGNGRGRDGWANLWVRNRNAAHLDRLTKRECEVVRLLGRRWEAREIAEALGISYSTVRSHLRSIYAKFDVRTRQEAIKHAVRLLHDLEDESPNGKSGMDGTNGTNDTNGK